MKKLKYEGYLLVSDIDGTLIGEEWRISDENASAIKHFTDNGGIFTLATGRILHTIRALIQNTVINAPIICYNGAVIYDLKENKTVWRMPLTDECFGVIEDVMQNMPESGIEIYNENNVYIYRNNIKVERHKLIEELFNKEANRNDIAKPWIKVIFVQEKEQTQKLRQYIKSKNYEEKLYFAQSCDEFYEMLNQNANKGNALSRLKAMLPGITKVIAVGDNENDLEMIKFADVGIATGNALSSVKNAAKLVSVDCTKHAIAHIIEKLI